MLPKPICMDCGEEQDIWEFVATEWHRELNELWVWCPVCQVETFHPLGENE